ncbi:flagellar hook-length control protein FliK [Paracoccus homiensis]|uniref:flagellar hook-length control protein FliK n=1 Tax=Paracoccus homiensis TaxID=364199 RepID=UPI00398C921B
MEIPFLKIDSAETSRKPRDETVVDETAGACFEIDVPDQKTPTEPAPEIPVDDVLTGPAQADEDGLDTDPVAQLMAAWTGTTAELPRSRATMIDGDTPALTVTHDAKGAKQLADQTAIVGDSLPDPMPETDPPAQPTEADLADDPVRMSWAAPKEPGANDITDPKPALADQRVTLTQAALPDMPAEEASAPPQTPQASEARSEPQQTQHSVQALRAVPPTPVSRQLADAAIRTRDELVEITLSPEELGRVRMVLGGHDRTPHLTIWADRPETLDQMRRHAEDLAEELRGSGMEGAQLDFRDGDAGQNWQDPEWAAPLDASAQALTEHIAPAPSRDTVSLVALSSGWGTRHIDIRI